MAARQARDGVSLDTVRVNEEIPDKSFELKMPMGYVEEKLEVPSKP